MQPTSGSTRIDTISLDRAPGASLSVSASVNASVSSAAYHQPPAPYNDPLAGLKASDIDEAQTVPAGHTIRSTQFGPLPAVPSSGSAPDHTDPATQEREKYHGATLVHPLMRLKGQNTKVHELKNAKQPTAKDETLRRSKKLALKRDASELKRTGSGPPTAAAQRLFRSKTFRPGGSLRNESVIEEDDIGGDERTANYLGLYATTFSVVGLTIGDFVLFAIFQMFTHAPQDVVCRKTEKDDGSGQEVHYRLVNVIILAATIALHFFYILERVRHVDKEESWRAFYARFLSLNAWHLVTLLGSAIALALHAELCHRATSDLSFSFVRKLHLVAHGLRVLCVLRCCWHLRADLRRRLQHAVSLNKRRYVDRDMGLDLDMTYIADRLVSMSLPCVDNAPYRNDIADVARFFASKHYGSFAVVNLCEAQEEGGNGNYDTALLFGQVQKCPFPDHNAPSFLAMLNYCEAATDFLNQGGKNVVAVHCQGGKGRTGLLCCALLLWVGMFDQAEDTLNYFAKRRTQSGVPEHCMSRVSSPSQIRYLGYLQKMVQGEIRFEGFHPLLLKTITILNPPGPPLYAGGWQVAVVIEQGGTILYDCCKAHGPAAVSRPEEGEISIRVGDLLVHGDVTVRVYRLEMDNAARIPMGTNAQIFQAGRGIKYGTVKGRISSFVSVHTAVLCQELERGTEHTVTYQKSEIDGPHKDDHNHIFPKEFAIAITVEQPDLRLVPSYVSQSPDAKAPMELDAVAETRRGSERVGVAPHVKAEGSSGRMITASSLIFTSLPTTNTDDQESPVAPPLFDTVAVQMRDLEAQELVIPVQEHVTSTTGPAGSKEAYHEGLGRMQSVARELVVGRALDTRMRALCAEIRTFSRGETVLDTRLHPPPDSGPMMLYYVLSGRVTCESGKAGPVGGWSGCLRMSDVPTLATAGPGQLMGVLALEEVVPGGRSIGGGLVFTARSAEVVVVAVPLQRRLNDASLSEENSAADAGQSAAGAAGSRESARIYGGSACIYGGSACIYGGSACIYGGSVDAALRLRPRATTTTTTTTTGGGGAMRCV